MTKCNAKAAPKRHSTWLKLARQQSRRFWGKVRKTDGCWEWLCGKDKDGYGKFAITAPHGCEPKQKHVRAHRLSWELRRGPIPRGLLVIHTCDNPLCVRLSHLRLGTQADNRADCARKGRTAKGERHSSKLHPETVQRGESHWHAILSERQVLQARALYRRGVGPAALARRFRVAVTTMAPAVTGRSWSHLP